jgi:hypothetical protein
MVLSHTAAPVSLVEDGPGICRRGLKSKRPIICEAVGQIVILTEIQ